MKLVQPSALNRSILIDKGPARIAIEDNHFVMLQETSPEVYHGYIVEEFKNLPRKAKESLFYEN